HPGGSAVCLCDPLDRLLDHVGRHLEGQVLAGLRNLCELGLHSGHYAPNAGGSPSRHGTGRRSGRGCGAGPDRPVGAPARPVRISTIGTGGRGRTRTDTGLLPRASKTRAAASYATRPDPHDYAPAGSGLVRRGGPPIATYSEPSSSRGRTLDVTRRRGGVAAVEDFPALV